MTTAYAPAPAGAAPMDEPDDDVGGRRLVLTPASEISVRPAKWLWDKRIPAGSLTLLAGREGIGKSTVAAELAAQITRGDMPGYCYGTPRSVIVAATEDSWSHTLGPRFLAAGADMSRIYRVDVSTDLGAGWLDLPRDIRGLTDAIADVNAAAVILDPLMSRLSATLDTHRDAEVRRALEPLARAADATGAAFIGLIHVSKARTTDPLNSVMGSRAFSAVARAVLYSAVDPDDETTRLLGIAKSNLGPLDLPTLAFRIEGTKVADSPEGPVFAGRVMWTGERQQTMREVMEAADDTTEARSATTEAGEWLLDHLAAQGGTDASADVRTAGQRAGHSHDSLKRARRKLGITTESVGFPRRTYWTLPDSAQSERDSGSSSGESALTALTALTEPVGAVGAVGASVPARAHARNEGGS